MSRKRIIIATIIIIALPIIISLILLIFNNQTICDKDFWYGYMQFAGTVLLAGFALYQTQKNIDDNEKSQKKIEEFQKALIDANERANSFAHYVYNIDKQNYKACFIPDLYLHQGEEKSRHYCYFTNELRTGNIGNDVAVVKKSLFKCGEYTHLNDNLNFFIGNHDAFSEFNFDVSPDKDKNKFALYLFLVNKYGNKYVEALYIDYKHIKQVVQGEQFKIENFNLEYFDTWDIKELEDIENGQT